MRLLPRSVIFVLLSALFPATGFAYLHGARCPTPSPFPATNPFFPCPLYQSPPLTLRHPLPEYAGDHPDDPDAQGRWYYCRKPKGYYPRVRLCPDGWTTVTTPPPEIDEEEE